ncbi:MAG: 4Fe-4S dicluster domain-containing protein [Verrucomicrobia bacterium]|nr:4Fe-4S dicluster domain-containing protein [Verrucomicrobiota bacterium]
MRQKADNATRRGPADPAGDDPFAAAGLSRRRFMELMSASMLLAGAGLTGCRRPEEELIPFLSPPEGYAHDAARFYAACLPGEEEAVPLLLKCYEGRPIKVEGNPRHPLHRALSGPDHPNWGGAPAFAQAAILSLYDPDRARRFARDGKTVSRETAWDYLASLGARFRQEEGRGLAFLVERRPSPTRDRLLRILAAQFPKASWHEWSAAPNPGRRAIETLFGRAARPLPHPERASRVLALDADLVGEEEAAWLWTRALANARRLGAGRDPFRLYALETQASLTGERADHRLGLRPSLLRAAAARLLQLAAADAQGEPWEAFRALPLERAAAGLDSLARAWVEACWEDLAARRGRALVWAGSRQPPEIHLIAWTLNMRLGAPGRALDLLPEPSAPAASAAELLSRLEKGEVRALIILGANPVYAAPGSQDWPGALRKAGEVLRLASYEDETFPYCQWHFPEAHPFESWSDCRTSDGSWCVVQPGVKPLFGGATAIEFLARLGGLPETDPLRLVRQTFREALGARDFEAAWRRILQQGFWEGAAPKPIAPAPRWEAALATLRKALEQTPETGPIELTLRRDLKVGNGRWANNAWLLEAPDPLTQVAWENALLLGPETARRLGLAPWDPETAEAPTARLRIGERALELPVWIEPAMPEGAAAAALGWGRTRAGRVGSGRGVNLYPLRPDSETYQLFSARVEPTGRKARLACVQGHWDLDSLPLFQKERPRTAARRLYENPLAERAAQEPCQWGMAIDLNACVGCGACVIACQAENNIPVVGKDQVLRRREMHWIRIERYRLPRAEEAARPIRLPMLCQHCEDAPCEYVCPFNATVHDAQGLNLMVYNRCGGARYCSNNCPYKVRRFNFFDYLARTAWQTAFGAPSPAAASDGTAGREPSSSREPRELFRLHANPQVTVRMRGVMEKCTFCVQRIEEAKVRKKLAASSPVEAILRDGEVAPACEQACPAGAVVFGNLNDPQSRAARMHRDPRAFRVLESLGTRPRVAYLASKGNPNPRVVAIERRMAARVGDVSKPAPSPS